MRRGTRCIRHCHLSRFGGISGFSREEMLVLAAENGGNPGDPNKRNPLDFVLWATVAFR